MGRQAGTGCRVQVGVAGGKSIQLNAAQPYDGLCLVALSVCEQPARRSRRFETRTYLVWSGTAPCLQLRHQLIDLSAQLHAGGEPPLRAEERIQKRRLLAQHVCPLRLTVRTWAAFSPFKGPLGGSYTQAGVATLAAGLCILSWCIRRVRSPTAP